jgi:hypothetical protein
MIVGMPAEMIEALIDEELKGGLSTYWVGKRPEGRSAEVDDVPG